ncbi:hypothetical protein Dda_8285 [Drechslerella dactyloides]|uniref:RRM domain-containing protein n=1 Tax=Drechslerella dactyloides TaxID=74499 RepID=A0AAD6NFD0_DREDA|nr:hypothetical protein Dda_8285 [Drechslerella dactyloides]
MAQQVSSPVEPTKDKSSKKRKHSSLENPEKELEIDVNLPEPPSKKDLRKLKKLKSKGVDTDALTSLNVPLIDRSKKGAQEGETPAGTTASASKRSPYGVWIGNLSFSTTREDLIRFFTRGSEEGGDDGVEGSGSGIRQKDITRVHLPKSTKFKNQNKGFAYVDFLTAGCISHALALSETLYNGRKVLIKASTDFNGRPEDDPKKASDKGSISGGSNPPSRSVFVGNLGYEVKEAEVFSHFSPAGKIKKVRFMTFQDSGKCKGFCWVDFEELKSAENVFAGKIEGAHESEDEESEDEDEDAEKGSGESDDDQPKKKRKGLKKEKKNKRNPYTFMGGRKLRLEYGEDPTTRYKKRFGDSKPEDGGGDPSQRGHGNRDGSDRRDRAGGPRKELTVEEKQAKTVESRLTGRIVEGTGKKVTFD